MTTTKPEQIERRSADADHDVVTVQGGHGGYRRTPCGGCPWRVDQTLSFPAEAFALSARTAEDMSTHTFGCHESGTERPVTCAGFLLRGADHNMGVRLKIASGDLDPDSVHDGGLALHAGYVDMAVANGLDRHSDALRGCRESSHEREALTCGTCGGQLRILDERDGYRALDCRSCGAEWVVELHP